MPNLSQIKRERMMAFLQKIKDEHRDDDEMLIALGEIESKLNAKKYGLVWEQHEEAVDVMMQDNIPVFTEVAEKKSLKLLAMDLTSFLRVTIFTPFVYWKKHIKAKLM